jgi:hypothetical protein
MHCKVFLDREAPTNQRSQQVIEEKSMTGSPFSILGNQSDHKYCKYTVRPRLTF